RVLRGGGGAVRLRGVDRRGGNHRRRHALGGGNRLGDAAQHALGVGRWQAVDRGTRGHWRAGRGSALRGGRRSAAGRAGRRRIRGHQ
ncbi:MAG: hypothetical protein ACRDL7_11210, partial [Gaiellaceae bacterium]